MLGLGFGEIILVLIVALLVLGPEKLPQLAQQLGKGLREFRRLANDFQHNLNEIEHETRQALDTEPMDTPKTPSPESAPNSDAEAQPETNENPASPQQTPAPSAPDPKPSYSTREPGTQAPMERLRAQPSETAPESPDEGQGPLEEPSPKADVNLSPAHTVPRDDN